VIAGLFRVHPHHEFFRARIEDDFGPFDKHRRIVIAGQIGLPQRDAFAFPVEEIRRGITRNRAADSRRPVFAIPVINVAVDKDAAAVRLNRLAIPVAPDFAGMKFRIGARVEKQNNKAPESSRVPAVLIFISMAEIIFRMQFVEDRMVERGNDGFFRADQIENHDLIFAPLEPRAGHIHRLRRADVPETAETMAVHPSHAFAPRSQVQKRVAGFFDVHGRAPECGQI